MGICKLCLKEKQLLKQSHIIPDFMYSALYDEKHKIIVFSTLDLKNGLKKVRMPSSGEYESNILCADCDNGIINREYENYSRRVLYGGNLQTSKIPVFVKGINQHGVKFLNCTNISYTKFKLFLLSILWKSSISSRPLFSEVKLDEVHEENLRKMILNKNPGTVEDYPIFIWTFKGDLTAPTDFIGHPRTIVSDSGHTTITFIIDGFVFVYFLPKEDLQFPPEVLSETIKPTNDVNLIEFPEGRTMEFISAYYNLHNLR